MLERHRGCLWPWTGRAGWLGSGVCRLFLPHYQKVLEVWNLKEEQPKTGSKNRVAARSVANPQAQNELRQAVNCSYCRKPEAPNG
jgi:hypothetical protein